MIIRTLVAAAALGAAVFAPAAFADEPLFSTAKSTVGQLLDNAAAKAAFVKVMPDLANNPQLEQGREMTLQAISEMGYADAEKLKELDVELAKIKAE